MVPVGVLDRRSALADPTHPGHRLHHRRPSRARGCLQLGEQRGTAGESAHPRRDRPHPPLHGGIWLPGGGRPLLFRAGQRGQRLQQRGLQLSRAGHRRGGHTAVGQPIPERLLASPILQIAEQRCGAFGVLAEQEHQPGQAPLLGGLVLQLGVGQLRPVTHRRPVPEPCDQHEHIRRRDCLPAHLRRLVVPCREVRHVRDGVTSPRHRRLRRRDE